MYTYYIYIHVHMYIHKLYIFLEGALEAQVEGLHVCLINNTISITIVDITI